MPRAASECAPGRAGARGGGTGEGGAGVGGREQGLGTERGLGHMEWGNQGGALSRQVT